MAYIIFKLKDGRTMYIENCDISRFVVDIDNCKLLVITMNSAQYELELFGLAPIIALEKIFDVLVEVVTDTRSELSSHLIKKNSSTNKEIK